MNLTTRFFDAVCRQSDGNDAVIVNALEIGAVLHMSGADVFDVVDDLQERGLIVRASLDAGHPLGEVLVRLTIFGVATCDSRAARHPQNS